MADETQYEHTVVNPQTGERQGWNGKQWVPIPKAAAAGKQAAAPAFTPPKPLSERIEAQSAEFAHHAGLPAFPSEVPDYIKNLILPEEDPEHPGFGQTIPLLGPLFKAQKQTFDKPGWGNKVAGMVPIVGPLASTASEDLANHNWAGMGGDILNMLMLGKGMSKGMGGELPGSPRAAMEEATGRPNQRTPWMPNQKLAPGVIATNAPKGALGRYVAARWNIRPDFAAKVGESVEAMQKARQDAEASTQSIDKSLEARKSGIEQSTTQQVTRAKTLRNKVIANFERELKETQTDKLLQGRSLIADTTNAVWQEYQKVRAPFQEIGKHVGSLDISGEQIRNAIKEEVKAHGARTSETPAAAFKALPASDNPAESIMVTASGEIIIPSAEELIGGTSVHFNDLTRVREDLYAAASSSKDSSVKYGLYSAADRITALQEQAADDAGQGPQYKAAKAAYKEFRRGIGSPMIEHLISARDAEQQALLPKIARLVSPKFEEAMTTVLRSVGITIEPLHETLARAKEISKAIPTTKKAYTAAFRDIHADASTSMKQAVRDAATRRAEAVARAKEQIKQAEGLSRGIVRGKTVRELAGLSNEQINRQRLQEIAERGRTQGITSPAALMQILYGITAALTFSRLYGVARLGMGTAMMTRDAMPILLRDPEFQGWVLKRAGVIPGSPAESGLRQGLVNLSREATKGFFKAAARTLPAASKEVGNEVTQEAEAPLQ